MNLFTRTFNPIIFLFFIIKSIKNLLLKIMRSIIRKKKLNVILKDLYLYVK